MTKVEFYIFSHGKAKIYIENDQNAYKCDVGDIFKIFSSVGRRIEEQFKVDGNTIFMLGKKQVEKVRDYLTDPA